MAKARDDVEQLKQNWLRDPCYDLWDVEGFEEYHDDLSLFQATHEARFAKEHARRYWERVESAARERWAQPAFVERSLRDIVLDARALIDEIDRQRNAEV